MSFTNDDFRESLEREPAVTRPACVRCHAPELTVVTQTQARANRVGVTCVTCHLPDAEQAGSSVLIRAATGDVLHPPLRPSAILRDIPGCAECHEFRFITPRPSYAKEASQWMQRTVREHYDGRVGESTCVTCHMPLIEVPARHHDHRFLGGHDERVLRGALDITAYRPNGGLVRVILTPKRVSHAVPTGDLFRRIAVYVEPVNYTALRGTYARFLTRHHVRINNGQRLEVDDDRPIQTPTAVDFELDYPQINEAVNYRVVYERVAHLRGDDERQAVVASRVVLAQGRLEAELRSGGSGSNGPHQLGSVNR